MKPKCNVDVRLLDIQAVNEGKDITDLTIIFSGTVDACKKYCQMFAGYKLVRDKDNLFGGYYANTETGDCFLLT